jgi:hypothetical protein
VSNDAAESPPNETSFTAIWSKLAEEIHFFNKKFNDDLLDNCLVNPRFLFQI